MKSLPQKFHILIGSESLRNQFIWMFISHTKSSQYSPVVPQVLHVFCVANRLKRL